MNCPLCRHGESRVVFVLPGYRVGECVQCRLWHNLDFAAQPKAVFSRDYYEDVQKDAFAHIANPDIKDMSEPIYKEGLEFVENKMGCGRLLDVGCAFGAFLEFAQKRGWQVQGVEVSPYSSKYAREEKKLEVTTGTLPEANLSAGQFDAVTFWDVLEHVREVDKNLSTAHALLKPGGFLIITTDNYRSLLAFIASALYKLSFGFFNYPVRKFFIPYNSCYFRPGVLRSALCAAGFDEVYFSLIDYPLQKLKLSPMERLAVGVLYAIGNALNLNSQFMIIARKKG